MKFCNLILEEVILDSIKLKMESYASSRTTYSDLELVTHQQTRYACSKIVLQEPNSLHIQQDHQDQLIRYADDTIEMATGAYPKPTKKKLQQTLDKIINYYDNWVIKTEAVMNSDCCLKKYQKPEIHGHIQTIDSIN